MSISRRRCVMLLLTLALPFFLAADNASAPLKPGDGKPLPGTQPLTWDDDIASRLVAEVDRFLLREIDRSVERRAGHWKRDLSSPENYEKSIEGNRKELARIVGVRDARVRFESPELLATVDRPALVGKTDSYEVYAIRWPAFGDVHGEGLLLRPVGRKPVADVVAIPDADQSPEQLVGLVEGTAPASQYARRLAESGCRVVVPVLIDRKLEVRGGKATMTSREFLYRPAFELGRHLVGYELQKVLAAVDWFARDGDGQIGVIGWGEGGLLALHTAAIDTRIKAACVSGYFDDRRNLWQEPMDRNVFGLLEQFGDAELAAMVTPRALIVEAAKGPEVTLPSKGGAPGRLVTGKVEVGRAEVERARKMVGGLKPEAKIELVVSGDGSGLCGTGEALERFLGALLPSAKLSASSEKTLTLPSPGVPGEGTQRQLRQMHEIDAHNQLLLELGADVRKQFMGKLDTTSPEKFRASAEEYRRIFYNDVIGRFELKSLPFNARTRQAYVGANWTGYEVVLDVYEDVIAYGILLLPNGMKAGEKRPVVVCQHGLEGRPQNLIVADNRAYRDYAAKLAERGFIVFAPQNLYLFGDRFRTLQRKANPIGKTLFSIITPQHQQIVDWLKTLPNVDGKRIAFYGLSYGGKTAMRVPALVTDYCLSICSGDFNDWVWKNASTHSTCSYAWMNEYEIFEWDLGSTFNYSEMAALIAPRPFMVERGHFDGVAPDDMVAREFAKVRFLYEARLNLMDRCRIEFFNGPHTINGKGTFAALHEWLNWPAR